MDAPPAAASQFWVRPVADVLASIQPTPVGLTSAEADLRRRRYGPNTIVREARFAGLVGFLRFLVNPLVIILLVASATSLALGDRIGGTIIIAMVLLSCSARSRALR